jgi:hypothetical protein
VIGFFVPITLLMDSNSSREANAPRAEFAAPEKQTSVKMNITK